MNVVELTGNGPAWTTVAKITIPSTIILFLLIWVGKFVWTWLLGREKSGGYLDKTRYFVGDRRENPTFPLDENPQVTPPVVDQLPKLE